MERGLGRIGKWEKTVFPAVPRGERTWNIEFIGLGNRHANCKPNYAENFGRFSGQPLPIVLCCQPPTTNGGVGLKNLDTFSGFC